MNENKEISDIKLTASQKAKKKYYDKIKNDPEYILRRNKNCNKYYHTCLKTNPQFKENESIRKREYYNKNKTELLLEIIL